MELLWRIDMSENTVFYDIASVGFLPKTREGYAKLLRRECLGLKEVAYTHQDGVQVILAEGSRSRDRDDPGMDFTFVKGDKFVHVSTNESRNSAEKKNVLTVAVGDFSLRDYHSAQCSEYFIDDLHSVKSVRDTLEKELPALKTIFDKYVPSDSMHNMINELVSSHNENHASKAFMAALNDWKSYNK